MSKITISSMHPAGVDLLTDTESFIRDLSDVEEFSVQGGSTPLCVYAGLYGLAFGVGLSIGITNNQKNNQAGDVV